MSLNVDLKWMEHKRVAVLWTPGLDSFFTRWILENEKPNYLTLNYVYFNINGMYSKEELKKLKEINKHVDIVDFDISNLEDHNTAYLPNRNVLFVSYAQALYNADVVLISGTSDDRVSDNDIIAHNAMSNLLSVTSKRRIEVKSILSNFSKSELIRKFIIYDDGSILLNNVFSCYAPVREPFKNTFFETGFTGFTLNNNSFEDYSCMKCKACLRKAAALTTANIFIPWKDKKIELIEQYISSDGEFTITYPDRYETLCKYRDFNRWYHAIKYK